MILWDAYTGNNIRTLLGHTLYVSSVCFSSDDKKIVSGSYDHTIKVWDT
jgi:COMPASS component SWD3